MSVTAYNLRLPPRRTSAVVIASPHSGRDYPPSFLRESVLEMVALRSSEDAFVDDLVSSAPDFGIALLCANKPRAYVDLNRAEDELDPALISGVTRRVLNPRIASGLGVIPRVVSNGRAIYQGKISRAEAERRLQQVWHPYHARLRSLLDEQRAFFGQVILVDVHSMPHEAITTYSHRGGPCPDVVLGDRFGAACGADFMDRVEAVFASAGLRVARNAPFAGAFVAQHYGRPSQGQHVVQVEIDRALYMDEHRIAPHSGYGGFRQLMTGIVAKLAEIGRADGTELPLAAE